MFIRIAAWIMLLVPLAGGAAVYMQFTSDMRAAREALKGRSEIVESSSGPIEFAEQGSGPAVLSIHGAGGGFDQGLGNALSMMSPGFRIISPSRFGYLRTPVPRDVSPAAQADAHAALLDKLRVSKAIILGTSAGTRSALELALRYPDRVAALILVVPATYHPGAATSEMQREPGFPFVLWMVNAGADFAWWALEHVWPDTLIRFIGVPPEVLRSAAPTDREAVEAMIRNIEPLSSRFAGINIDSKPDLAERPLSQVEVPTLLITARDDLFDTLPAAQYAADHIPGARIVVYEQGGHLLVGHGPEVREEITNFLNNLGPIDR